MLGPPDGPSRLYPPRLYPPRPPSGRGGRLACLCKSLKDPLPLQKTSRGLAGLGALLEPAHDLVDVDLDLHRIRHRVVVAEVLDETPVPRRPGVSDHQAIERMLLCAHPSEPDLYQLPPP